MTEAEWLACEKPGMMLAFLRDRASDRKLRLFASACCRTVWGQLRERFGGSLAVEVAERHADGLANPGELDDARSGIEGSLELYPGEPVYDPRFYSCCRDMREDAGRYAAEYAARYAGSQAAKHLRDESEDAWTAALANEDRLQCRILTELFGPVPFRPLAFSSYCTTILSLAEAAYVDRALPSGHLDNARLAVLSDALEEAGCADADFLAHLRSPGPHVRGCWALDLVLGRG